MADAKPVILVDGYSYLYRAFHALPSLTNSKGVPTGATYGVVNMLRRLRKDYEPEHMAVILDAPGKTFRDELYAEYKANRPPMPDELRCQLDAIQALVEALGIPIVSIPGVEADDVMGTLAVQASEQGLMTLLSTSDKDMAQLVDEHVHLVNSMDNTRLDIAGVQAKFGVGPEQIVDYLALIGDSVDNVPGVPKVGPKTAAKWLKEYGSLENLVAHADQVKGKVGENLRACLNQLPLAKALVTIKRDVPVELGPTELALEAPDLARLRTLLAELEFKSWLVELLEDEHASLEQSDPVAVSYSTVLDWESLEDWLERLRAAELFAFDTETTSLDYMSARVVGVSFAIHANEAAYVPIGHDYPGAPTQLDGEAVIEALRPLLEDPAHKKLGQNLKYDMSVLANHGVTLSGVSYDTMLESYVLDSTATRHDMDSLALKYLGHRTVHFEDIAGKGAKQLTFNQVELEKAAHYAAEDADITLRLHQTLWPRLSKDDAPRWLFEEIEVPLIPVLSRMERNGVRVDADLLRRQSQDLAQGMRKLEQEAYEAAGEEFNLGSPRQIQTLLFEQQGLPVRAKTPKGQPSTAESVLQDLAADFELPRIILEHRALSKLKSTYADALPGCINARTGRVHTSYHQAVASTGRLSSSDPNLQNIPVRTENGRKIRKAFVASPGYVLVAADYSQIELRIMAHLSGDAGLRRAFEAGEDIHRATAAEVFGVPPEDVSADQRRSAKAINFGLIYGMSPFGLAKQLGIAREEARDYVDLYFSRYPGVKKFMDQTRALAHDQGFVETVFGRRLYLAEINARNAQRRQYAERTAINAPMQGTAADIIKRAMLRLHFWLEEAQVDARMIMQVHDELVFEVAQDDAEQAQAAVVDFMCGAAELSVPLIVQSGVADNWDDAH